MNNVYIIDYKRTATGSYLGGLSNFSATALGTITIKALLENLNLPPEAIENIYLGNVLSAGLGQSPARQAAIGAGIPYKTDATTINKVCASGMKALNLTTGEIELGQYDIAIAGGMESMSNAPHYTNIRTGHKMGNTALVDGLLLDGLTDAYEGYHMGNAAETTVREFQLTREEQDNYALRSYELAAKAQNSGVFKNEIVPVTYTTRKGEITIDKDEDITKLIPEKVPQLKPSFEKEGTITAANASNLNDGAASFVLSSQKGIEKYKLKPLAKIIATADGAQNPASFSTSPAIAIKTLLDKAQLKIDDIDCFEINEAYSSVVLANARILNIPMDKINQYGGAVAIGHPIGASGARITGSLVTTLKNKNLKYGIAAICNGGGGATAILVENIF